MPESALFQPKPGQGERPAVLELLAKPVHFSQVSTLLAQGAKVLFLESQFRGALVVAPNGMVGVPAATPSNFPSEPKPPGSGS
jgi:hypothetical protein